MSVEQISTSKKLVLWQKRIKNMETKYNRYIFGGLSCETSGPEKITIKILKSPCEESIGKPKKKKQRERSMKNQPR